MPDAKKMYSDWAREKRRLVITSTLIQIWQISRDVTDETLREFEGVIREFSVREWGSGTEVEFSCDDFKVVVKNPSRGLNRTFQIS